MSAPVGPDEIRRAADAALELPGVDDVEVVVMHEWGGITRFAGSEIHQSTSREDTDVRVRVASKGRIGVASTNDLSPDGAARAARSAKEMAEVVRPDPLWPGLAPPVAVPAVDRFHDSTANSTPEERADAVVALIGRCSPGFTAAGAFETQAMEIALANTQGQFCWEPITQASLTTVISGGAGGSGFAETFAGDVADIDPVAIGTVASDKAVLSQNPTALDPGTYVTVLEPAATSTLVGFLAWVGFGGRDYLEGRSCFSGKQGEQVAAPSVSVIDDALDPDTIGAPFDFEGVPRQRVELIRGGVFLDAVYDRRTAKEAGRDSTGHALPSPNPDGPYPLNLSMAPGDATLEQMIAATERGLLVTRFHYSNIVNPVESSITGMTRDGTFLIEHGEIAGPVMNFRFTQSILGALSSVSMIGNKTELASEFFFSASRVPAVRVDDFNFSGRSDH
jgi:predicted Zn-dependent protease